MSSVGAIDVYGLVEQLMQVERQPVTMLETRKKSYDTKAGALESLKSLLETISTRATAFDTSKEWDLLKASSTDSSVTTSVKEGGFSGSLTFSVNNLASSQKLYSTGTLGSTSDTITTADHALLAAGGTALGFGTISGDAGLALGSHTIAVTQASAAAVRTGSVLGTSVTIDNSNDELLVEVNGQEYTFALTHGTGLSRNAVVQDLNDQIAASGAAGAVEASLSTTGQLQLRTSREGSAATLQVTGGTALADLGLSVDASAVSGTDGKVKVGTVETTLSSIEAGGSASLAAGAGNVSVVFSGGLRTGSMGARNVDLGDGSLSAVVSAINSAGGDVGASAIKVGDGSYRFQIQSKKSGEAGRFNFDPAALFDGIGSFSTLSAGTDASIEVGGSSPFTITSSSNTFADVLPGVSFTLSKVPDDPVTVSAARDEDGIASKVSAMVDAANKAMSDIKKKTAYDSTTNIAGALSGDFTVRRLQQDILKSFTGAVATGTAFTSASQVGITLTKDGTLAFDKSKFLEAYQSDPSATQRLFFAADAEDDNPGIAQRLAATVKAANSSTSGYLTTAAQSQRDKITAVTKQIERWEDRLDMRQQALITQFSNLNTALQSLNSQSQWLSGQLAGLPGFF